MIAILMLSFTMIYLSISISAIQFNSETFLLYYVDSQTTTQRAFSTVTDFPLNMNLAGSPKTVYVAFKTNQILTEGSVVVMQAEFGNVYGTSAELMGVGQPNRQLGLGAVPSVWEAMPLNQRIIAFTAQNINSNNYRFTVTFQASGFTSQYVYMRLDNILPVGGATGTMTFANAELYDSVEDAAGSGTTPEEMREVLSSWSQEELIPGIGNEVADQIENKVPAAVEDALNNHDQHQETQAGSKIEEFKEQLQETIDPYFENTSEIRDALHGGLTGVFGYSGTNAVITLPAANNPMADGAQLWPQLTVDLGYWWNQLPVALRSMITIYATFIILYCCLSEMLDTINTILIHRELLGLPDDEVGIRARTRGD